MRQIYKQEEELAVLKTKNATIQEKLTTVDNEYNHNVQQKEEHEARLNKARSLMTYYNLDSGQ